MLFRLLPLAVLLFAATERITAARNASAPEASRAAAVSAPDALGTLAVTRRGDELHIRFEDRDRRVFRYLFRRCMFNELFTFYEVAVGERCGRECDDNAPSDDGRTEILLNRATSDNIGPLAIEGWGWIGANHTYRERGVARTARHIDATISADGHPLDRDTTLRAREVTIRVENRLLDPRYPVADSAGHERPVRPFCTERVTYCIRENNIEVAVSHRFLNTEPATVRTYYGMQSMFCDEIRTLTPGGAYADWTPQDRVSHFTKGDHPAFRRFVEKNDCGYQSTWLLPEGAGDHGLLTDADAVFIGNSSGKSYHRLIAGRAVRDGDSVRWRGVYTWFVDPIADDDELFCYEGIEGDGRVLFIDCKKACDRTVTLPGRSLRSLREIDGCGDLRIRRIDPHTLRIRSRGPGYRIFRTGTASADGIGECRRFK